MEERRRFARIPERSPIAYEIINGAKMSESITKDISQGGIRFLVHDFVPQNNLLKVKLTLQKVPFHFEAIVRLVWIRKEAYSERYEIGVEFVSLPEKAKEHLIDYTESVLQRKA